MPFLGWSRSQLRHEWSLNLLVSLPGGRHDTIWNALGSNVVKKVSDREHLNMKISLKFSQTWAAGSLKSPHGACQRKKAKKIYNFGLFHSFKNSQMYDQYVTSLSLWKTPWEYYFGVSCTSDPQVWIEDTFIGLLTVWYEAKQTEHFLGQLRVIWEGVCSNCNSNSRRQSSFKALGLKRFEKV